MIDRPLSRSFWLREFLWSDVAARMGKQVVPTDQQINDLRRLCTELLQPIRDDIGKPIVITSGLRPVWLNVMVGGSKTSEHIDGRAADFKVVGMTPYDVTKHVSQMRLPWNQCIHEFGRWSHISIPPAGIKPRRDVMTARVEAGATVYVPGVLPA